MKQAIVIVALCCLSSLGWASYAPYRADQRAWEDFKQLHRRSYTSPEESARKAIFLQNLHKLNAINSANSNQIGNSFRVMINKFTDRTPEELTKSRGLKAPERTDELRLNLTEDSFLSQLLNDDTPVPSSFDWRKQSNRIGPVKDQLNCGSCWAFATVGLLEGQEFFDLSKSEQLTQLSEQNLIDCDKSDDGCNGGNPVKAIEFIVHERGLDTEQDYPYSSGDGNDWQKCKFNQKRAFVSTKRVTGSRVLPQGDEIALKKAVARYGPVLVGINSKPLSFVHYKSGVYHDDECDGPIDHAVLAVGYGTDVDAGDYWIIKNSWGADWGENGFGRIARNKNNTCGIAEFSVVATISNA